MKSNYLLLFLTFSSLFVSCKDKSEISDDQAANSPSTLTKLQQPRLKGTSGDKLTSLIGYGYDATGYLDTTSARNKIIDVQSLYLLINKSHSSSDMIIYGNSFIDLLKKMSESGNISLSGIAMSAHLKSLWKMANKSDSIDSKCAFVYYSWIATNEYFRLDEINLQNFLTANFKNDINIMSNHDLISKYGTHMLTNSLLGKKFEVLYSIKSKDNQLESTVKDYFHRRMEQFFGNSLGIINDLSEINSYHEQIIYNTIGSENDETGVISATNNNENQILLYTLNSIQTSPKTVFILSNESLPLYELVSDPIKKQGLKDYIDSYMKK